MLYIVEKMKYPTKKKDKNYRVKEGMSKLAKMDHTHF